MKTVKHPDSVMVWGCFSASGRGGLYFLPKNSTMNSETYEKLLLLFKMFIDFLAFLYIQFRSGSVYGTTAEKNNDIDYTSHAKCGYIVHNPCL